MGKIGERMKNEGRDRQALMVVCGSVNVLLSIQEVKQIYAREQVIAKDENQFMLEGRAYAGYFLYDLLKQEKEMVNYAILLQSDKQDIILFVAKVLNVISLDKPCILPFYMLCPPFSYIENCYPIDSSHMGYHLNIPKLIDQYQIVHLEAGYGN